MKQAHDFDVELFPLGLGTNTVGNTTDAAESEVVLDAFVEGGGNFIDTADQYSFWKPGNEGGESEAILGAWMRKRRNRQDLIIATKVGGLPQRKGLEPKNIRAAVDDSLRRLQTDYVDLYYAHFDEESRPIEEIADSFDRLVQAGKVRYIGISNMAPERIEEWIEFARSNNLAVPVALQPEYSLVRRHDYEQKVAPLAERHRLAVFPYFALAAGFLTGKYRTKQDLEGKPRGGSVAAYMNDDGLRVMDAVRHIADERNVAPATVALAWTLAKPTISAPLASATSVKQLAELMAAPALELQEEDVAALDEASEPFARENAAR